MRTATCAAMARMPGPRPAITLPPPALKCMCSLFPCDVTVMPMPADVRQAELQQPVLALEPNTARMLTSVCLAAKASARTPLACSTVQSAVGPTCACKPCLACADDLSHSALPFGYHDELPANEPVCPRRHPVLKMHHRAAGAPWPNGCSTELQAVRLLRRGLSGLAAPGAARWHLRLWPEASGQRAGPRTPGRPLQGSCRMVVPAVDAAQIGATRLPPACISEPWSAYASHVARTICNHISVDDMTIPSTHLGTTAKPPRTACMRSPPCH